MHFVAPSSLQKCVSQYIMFDKKNNLKHETWKNMKTFKKNISEKTYTHMHHHRSSGINITQFPLTLVKYNKDCMYKYLQYNFNNYYNSKYISEYDISSNINTIFKNCVLNIIRKCN